MLETRRCDVGKKISLYVADPIWRIIGDTESGELSGRVADIIDTWVYRQGLLEFQFALATAVGLFKGVIGMALLVTSNRLVRKLSGSSLY